MLFLTESTLLFVNLLVTDYESNRKKSLSENGVRGWAVGVHERTTLKKNIPTHTTSNPSTTVTNVVSSQATKVNTPATTSTQYSVTDAVIATKFGGFNLDSDLEQETQPLEKQAAGKSNDNIALVCT